MDVEDAGLKSLFTHFNTITNHVYVYVFLTHTPVSGSDNIRSKVTLLQYTS